MKSCIKKLVVHGLSGNALEYLQDYLTNRYQFVKLCTEFQGSILGPTCFTMNIGDMPTMINSESEMFADDQTAFEINYPIDTVLMRLRRNLSKPKLHIMIKLTYHPPRKM